MNSNHSKLTGRLMLPVAALAAIAATAVAGPSASAADSYAGLEGNVTTNCVTKAEFKKVKVGMTRTKAQRIMGATSVQSFKHPAYPGYKFFDYRACGETGLAQLAVANRKVGAKAASWSYEWPSTPPPGDGEQPPPPPGTGGGGGQLPW